MRRNYIVECSSAFEDKITLNFDASIWSISMQSCAIQPVEEMMNVQDFTA